MSLINDALKRASQSDRNRRPQAALPRPMQPVAEHPPTGISWAKAVIVVAALALALAGWSFWKWHGAGHPVVAAAAVQPAQRMVAAPPPPAPKPAPIIQESPPPPAAPAPLPVVVAAPAPAPAPPVSVPEAWPIDLTVKAIFYSKANPRALVNGRMVETGDSIDGVLVTGILSNGVFLDWKGQTREIMLGGQ
jgi:hypothetical protein